ncbi:response regulator [Aquimarina agarilytica]|uniref:response regulator n=1 Tax=Aquimarina agarilytica TaxID=1087449 RepID=UPI000287C7F2|nr:response regulator [Aquimarina agarilytica]
MEKINSILLVDDSKPTNFYNKKVIEISKKVNDVFVAENGLDALDFLYKRKGNQPPNIIFLDINMPKMDGYEFLAKYSNSLAPKERENTLIVVLSTTNLEKDRMKMKATGLVHELIEKPLSKEDLDRISKYYLENYTWYNSDEDLHDCAS